MTIGETIHKLRIEKDMTLEELGKAIHVGRSTIFKYETGEVKNIPFDRILRLAEALNTTPGYLMGWEEEEAPSYRELEDKSVAELLEYFASRPDGKMLFSVAKDCTPEEVLQAVKIIEALKR